jgi:hypothetical protein
VKEVSAMKILNLTPHQVNIHKKDGSIITIEPSGVVWRLREEDTEITNELGIDTEGIEIVARRFSLDTTEVPEEVWSADIVIVSLPLLLALKASLGSLPERPLICAPDTGSGAIRDEKGQVKGARRLITIV